MTKVIKNLHTNTNE